MKIKCSEITLEEEKDSWKNKDIAWPVFPVIVAVASAKAVAVFQC